MIQIFGIIFNDVLWSLLNTPYLEDHTVIGMGLSLASTRKVNNLKILFLENRLI